MATRKGVRSRFWFCICQSSTLVVCAKRRNIDLFIEQKKWELVL